MAQIRAKRLARCAISAKSGIYINTEWQAIRYIYRFYYLDDVEMISIRAKQIDMLKDSQCDGVVVGKCHVWMTVETLYSKSQNKINILTELTLCCRIPRPFHQDCEEWQVGCWKQKAQ